MRNTRFTTPPLLSWDLAQLGYHKLLETVRRHRDQAALDELAKKYQWTVDTHTLLDTQYQALVLTDAKQIISWVNHGFVEMTGYGSTYARGRTPAFLQGMDTSPESLKRIRHGLKRYQRVSETLINYRKNGEAYTCEVKIIPLKNLQNTTTHYLAFEREVA